MEAWESSRAESVSAKIPAEIWSLRCSCQNADLWRDGPKKLGQCWFQEVLFPTWAQSRFSAVVLGRNSYRDLG